MRGEHDGRNVVCEFNRGSSPHARGTQREPPAHFGGLGIIPACAGNTALLPILTNIIRDHPRMRGEHERPWFSRGEREGSSPHARGTLAADVKVNMAAGIIPACAGNTFREIFREWGVWDHPRMRGEHTKKSQ